MSNAKRGNANITATLYSGTSFFFYFQYSITIYFICFIFLMQGNSLSDCFIISMLRNNLFYLLYTCYHNIFNGAEQIVLYLFPIFNAAKQVI